MDLRYVRDLCECVLVSQGNIYHPMVHERRERVRDSDFLTSTLCARRYEYAAHLARKRALGPQGARRVPEGLPLRREVTKTGGNPKEEGVEVDEVVWKEDWIAWTGRGVHEFEDIGCECFFDSGSICQRYSGRQTHLRRPTDK